MLLRLRRHPDLSDRLLFGSDSPLSVFHFLCWGRVPLGVLTMIIRTKNRFDRQYSILKALGIGFRSRYAATPTPAPNQEQQRQEQSTTNPRHVRS